MSEMTKMREALLYVGSAHESVKRDALAEVEQWESELEVMAGALESKDADLAAAREALKFYGEAGNYRGSSADVGERRGPSRVQRDKGGRARAALARLSAGKETA